MWRFDGHINIYIYIVIYSLNLYTQARLRYILDIPRRFESFRFHGYFIARYTCSYVTFNLSILLDALVSLPLSLPLSWFIRSLKNRKFRILFHFEKIVYKKREGGSLIKKEKRVSRNEIKKSGRGNVENIEYWNIYLGKILPLKFWNTYEYCSSSSDMFAGGHGTATRKQNHRLTQFILNSGQCLRYILTISYSVA